MTLFGHGLTPKRPLSQPGQFVCQERVEVLGPKGSFPKVAVLGPERKEGQVEISLTDAVTLGVPAPVRLSGQVREYPGITLRGPKGEVRLHQVSLRPAAVPHAPDEAAARDSPMGRWYGSRCSPVVP
ncbi:MAG: PduL/EutD family phosphate acyltransferase [Oscillospiraceae bacterium]